MNDMALLCAVTLAGPVDDERGARRLGRVPVHRDIAQLQADEQGLASWAYEFNASDPGPLPISDLRVEVLEWPMHLISSRRHGPKSLQSVSMAQLRAAQ